MPDDSQTPGYLRPDAAWEDQKARLWAMTTDERIAAMRAGRLSLRLCAHWASQAPDEVPVLEGEWEFIACSTPEVADAHESATATSRPRR